VNNLIKQFYNLINYLSQYPKIGTAIASIFGLFEVPLLDLIYFIDKRIKPGSYSTLMKYFSLFYKSKIIPLNAKIEGRATLAPTDEILALVKRMPSVSLGYCYCRTKYQNCENPIWTCIHIGTAKHLEELGKKIPLKKANYDEIEKLLIKADKLGLVHQLLTAPTNQFVYVICNCCLCCCVMLRNAIEYNIRGAVLPSNYIIEHNPENCINCGSCVENCHFGALTIKGVKLVTYKELCLGCGLCINKCENDALHLASRFTKDK